MMDEDARYRTSSQYRNWSFTPQSLHALRTQTNALAIERNKVSFARRALQAAQHPNSSESSNLGTPAGSTSLPGSTLANGSTPAESGANTPVGSGAVSVEEMQFLTVGEELKLLRVFGGKVLEIGDHLKLPTDIKATALQFFTRFYLHNSFQTYPPIPILKTCLFLACKAEHYNLQLSVFCSELSKTSPADVIGPEFLLTQSLKFNLDVRHPFRGLEGTVMECMSVAGGAEALPNGEDAMDVDGGDKENRVRAAHGRAREALKTQALLTDVYFHYTPSQIMLASLYLADAELVEWYLGVKFPDTALRQKVASTVQECAQMMRNMEAPLEMAELKTLNKKLKKCQDPEKADLAKRKAERMEKRNQLDPEEEERKAKKRRMEKEKQLADDPFGAPLPKA